MRLVYHRAVGAVGLAPATTVAPDDVRRPAATADDLDDILHPVITACVLDSPVRPFWASDGSGLHASSPSMARTRQPSFSWRTDGTESSRRASTAEPWAKT
jgi:hypothetical protein